MKQVFNPGCALLIYKPHYVEKIHESLNEKSGEIDLHTICCRHEPMLTPNTQIINVCPGCNRRFGSLYDGISTVTLWETLSASYSFPFPDYGGKTMTIHDACPIRAKGKVHDAVRLLLKKMNINVIEPQRNRSSSICCGDDFYPKIALEQVHAKMRERAESMPCTDVCVYCVSCIKSMYIGGKKPRYLLDLLFNEETEPQIYDTVEWHEQLQRHIDEH